MHLLVGDIIENTIENTIQNSIENNIVYEDADISGGCGAPDLAHELIVTASNVASSTSPLQLQHDWSDISLAQLNIEEKKMSSLRPAILVISDTASQDPQTDKAGPALTDAFSQRSNTWAAPIVRIVPDDPEKIQTAIKEWADNESDFVNLIVTSGGTGFAVRDVTPEVRGFALSPFFKCQLLIYINSMFIFYRQSHR